MKITNLKYKNIHRKVLEIYHNKKIKIDGLLVLLQLFEESDGGRLVIQIRLTKSTYNIFSNMFKKEYFENYYHGDGDQKRVRVYDDMLEAELLEKQNVILYPQDVYPFINMFDFRHEYTHTNGLINDMVYALEQYIEHFIILNHVAYRYCGIDESDDNNGGDGMTATYETLRPYIYGHDFLFKPQHINEHPFEKNKDKRS